MSNPHVFAFGGYIGSHLVLFYFLCHQSVLSGVSCSLKYNHLRLYFYIRSNFLSEYHIVFALSGLPSRTCCTRLTLIAEVAEDRRLQHSCTITSDPHHST